MFKQLWIIFLIGMILIFVIMPGFSQSDTEAKLVGCPEYDKIASQISQMSAVERIVAVAEVGLRCD